MIIIGDIASPTEKHSAILKHFFEDNKEAFTKNVICNLEGLISGRNLSQRLQQPLEVIFTAAANGDLTSLAIAEDAAKWLGRGLYNLITTLDLRCILMGGIVTG